MIANFFQSLRRRNVEYLLISGQATVLYGAATFSEDVDLWINPTADNAGRLAAALGDVAGRYYKLTPQLNVTNLRSGHGFHFLLPCAREGNVFLDVMGAPPRAGSFAVALAGARWMESDWGEVHTVGLKALVELKKTQRLEDYPIISKLALAWSYQPECAKAAADFRWAIRNIFTLPELELFFEEQPTAIRILQPEHEPALHEFAQQVHAGGPPAEAVARRVAASQQRRIARLQQADRRYWRDIIADLKRLRAHGKLMPEGAAVQAHAGR